MENLSNEYVIDTAEYEKIGKFLEDLAKHGIITIGKTGSSSEPEPSYVIKPALTDDDVDFDMFMTELSNSMNGSHGGSLEKHLNKSRHVLSLKKEEISKWLQN